MICRRPPLRQASLDHPCSETGPTSGRRHCRKLQLGSFSFSVSSSRVSSLRACVTATTAQSHLCYCPSRLGCVLGGPSSQSRRLSPWLLWALEASADATRFLVQRCVAQSQAVFPRLLTCLGKLCVGLADTSGQITLELQSAVSWPGRSR